MASPGTATVPFLGIRLACVALGASGRSAFLAIGLAFVVLGIVLMTRRRS